MSKTKNNSNVLDRKTEARMISDENAKANTAIGEANVPFSTLTDVTEQLSPASQSIVFRSFAHSAQFQAISLAGDLFVARSQPVIDELAVERLERRFNLQAGVYNYFREEAATYAESKYDEVMAFDQMYDYVLASAPKDPTRDPSQYDPAFLKSIGLTAEQAMESDAEQYAKDLATFKLRADSLASNRAWVQQAIDGVGACTPDLPVGAAYRMLQKAELKLADEPVRLWPKRNVIPGAFAKMACITGDLPKLAMAIKRLRDAYKGDDRVRFDD